jgi:hypothetical protein
MASATYPPVQQFSAFEIYPSDIILPALHFLSADTNGRSPILCFMTAALILSFCAQMTLSFCAVSHFHQLVFLPLSMPFRSNLCAVRAKLQTISDWRFRVFPLCFTFMPLHPSLCEDHWPCLFLVLFGTFSGLF